jgi:hypothetical protein
MSRYYYRPLSIKLDVSYVTDDLECAAIIGCLHVQLRSAMDAS